MSVARLTPEVAHGRREVVSVRRSPDGGGGSVGELVSSAVVVMPCAVLKAGVMLTAPGVADASAWAGPDG